MYDSSCFPLTGADGEKPEVMVRLTEKGGFKDRNKVSEKRVTSRSNNKDATVAVSFCFQMNFYLIF